MIAKILIVWTTGLSLLGLFFLYSGHRYFTEQPLSSSALTELQSNTCMQPCWQNVQIGITQTEDRDLLPQSSHFQVLYSVSSNEGMVQRISLSTSDPIRLGDIMAVWNTMPSHIVAYRGLLPHSNIDQGELYFGTGYELYFFDSLVVVRGMSTNAKLTPDLPISFINYYEPSEYGPPRPLEAPIWDGFFIAYPIQYVAGGE